MSQDSYTQFVEGLCKPGDKIISDLTPQSAHLLHMSSALMGEAGELFDIIKKHAIYAKKLDADKIAHIKEELGDIEFYLEGLRSSLGIKREEVVVLNMAKLAKRYEKGSYSNAQAQARADKQ